MQTNLEQDNTNTPPVASTVVILASDDFRRHVLTGPYHALGELSSLRAIEPVQDGPVRCILLHAVALTRSRGAIDHVDCLERSLTLLFLLNILLVALDVQIEVLQKAVALLVVVALVVHPVPVKC